MLRAVLIDLNGTLHIENSAIPGCIEALQKLISTKLHVRFVTNTTKESTRLIYDRLQTIGFNIDKNHIVSSLSSAKIFIKKENLKPLLLISPEALEDFEDVKCTDKEQPNAVVIGLAPTEFHYDRLNEAFKLLKNGGRLIGIHAGRYYKTAGGLSLGPGCFVKGLEYSAGIQAELVGKPNQLFFLNALDGIPPEEAVMIGDDVNDDIKGAMNAGLKGYLVKTGKYLENDEKTIDPPPTAVFNSFVEAVERILEELKA